MAYSTQSNVEAIFGAENVARWGRVNTDDDSSDVATNVTNAIAWADAQIDGLFQDGPYAIPFATVPTLVAHWSALLAGVYLYRRRGMSDDDEAGNKLTEMEKDARREMAWYVSGSRRFSIATQHTGPTAPVVVGTPRGMVPDTWGRRY